MAWKSTEDWRQDFTGARREFDRWRSSRRPGARIPEALWQSAVDLAGKHGVSRTAASLHLDYYALKKRLGASPPPRRPAAERPRGFVELPMGALAPGASCVVELEGADGSHQRLELTGLVAPELEGLVRSLRGHSPLSSSRKRRASSSRSSRSTSAAASTASRGSPAKS